jgi:PadR family transcriptional regulator PadR
MGRRRMYDRHHGGERSRPHWPRGGRVRGFMQPRLLLLLAQKPSHGYELMEALGQGEDPGADPGLLYRTLRHFERDGLVRSSWATEGRGPARRVYEITEDGLEYLHAWAANILRTRERLDRFLADYKTCFPSSGERR